jgi:DNA polymerase III subunit epsilon
MSASMIFGGLDIETTGLKQSEGHRIIEVAMSLRDYNGRVIGSVQQLIDPQRSIDPEAQAVHKIDYGQLIGKPTWDKFAPKLAALMGRCTYIVAHNGEGFDLPFIGYEFMRVGVAMPQVRVMDTMLHGRWATPDGSVPNLGALCWACEVDYDPNQAHSALYDVNVMMECFFKARSQNERLFPLPERFFTLPPLKEAA